MAFAGLDGLRNTVERYQGLKEAVEGTKIEIIDLSSSPNQATCIVGSE